MPLLASVPLTVDVFPFASSVPSTVTVVAAADCTFFASVSDLPAFTLNPALNVVTLVPPSVVVPSNMMGPDVEVFQVPRFVTLALNVVVPVKPGLNPRCSQW